MAAWIRFVSRGPSNTDWSNLEHVTTTSPELQFPFYHEHDYKHDQEQQQGSIVKQEAG